MRLGPYEVQSLLGAGGMGEVYRARDTELGRDVALKILPEVFAADSERAARFEREAKVLASLNHPHIAQIHGLVGTDPSAGSGQDSGKALVLELVEGPTLAERIAKGPLPLDEALPIATQVAEALEAAHEHGIIHRDLKPANIKVREDGTVKVLDFGLAKALQAPTDAADLANSPTITSPATHAGVILGTAAYMSPEQARGKRVDKRTDIWAFGCVLYELLAGRQAFAGDAVSDLVVAVLTKEPDWTSLPPATPPRIVELLRRCLKKDPRQRLHDIADARLDIEEVRTRPVLHEPGAAPPRSSRPLAVTSSVAVASLVIGSVIGWLATRTPLPEPVVTQVQLSVDPADQLTGSWVSVRPSSTAFALSPDGRLMVFSGSPSPVHIVAPGGEPLGAPGRLYLRGLDRPEATPIPGTEGGLGPFFSPDGQWIGFFARNQIKKVPVDGGPAVVICDVPRVPMGFGLFGASWADDDTIFFSERGDGISKVSSGGGSLTAVTTSDVANGERHLLPQALPGGKAVMFTILSSLDWNKAQVVLQLLDTGERRVLIRGGQDARYLKSGHLLYMNLGTLMAVPFDAPSGQVVGDPVALLDDVMQAVNSPNTDDETGAGQFSVSDSGTLAYVTGGIHPTYQATLVWVDRQGTAVPVSSTPARSYWSVRLSPDEASIALTFMDENRKSDVWLMNTARGALTRLTAEGWYNWPAIWSPDGKRLAFGSDRSGSTNVYTVSADASGKMERLTTGDYEQSPSSWTAQPSRIAFVEYHPPNGQVWVVPVDGDRKPELFLESAFDLQYPEFSPDGRWMAYVSAESTPAALFVQPYPGPGSKHRISTGGAMEPAWTRDGRELLYRDGQKFYSVTITSLDPFRAEAPRLLFEGKPGEYAASVAVRSWDVSRDGQRFLLVRNEESKDKPVTRTQLVLNWTAELGAKVPAKK